MIKTLKLISIFSLFLQSLFAGESALTKTYQPLDGLGSGRIMVTEVSCHDWFSHSGMPTYIGLICAPNIPPTNNLKHATNDLNLASSNGLKFQITEVGNDFKIIFNASSIKKNDPKGWSGDMIVKATLECLRKSLPNKHQHKKIEVILPKGDTSWLKKIVTDFNNHDRTKVFFQG